MNQPTSTAKPNKGDLIVVFIAVGGTVVSFLNIYKFASDRQPGNALWAGIALFAFSLLLATRLANMRQQK